MKTEEVIAALEQMPKGVPVVVNMGRIESCNGMEAVKVELVEAQLNTYRFDDTYESYYDKKVDKHLVINIEAY